MGSIRELKEAVVDYLRLRPEFQGVSLLQAYPARPREHAPARPVLAVGIGEVELSSGGMGDYLGEGDGGELYGRCARITLTLDLYAPVELGGEVCIGLYEALCDALLISGRLFGFQAVRCGELCFDSRTGANRLPVHASLSAAFARADQALGIREFEIGVKENDDSKQ